MNILIELIFGYKKGKNCNAMGYIFTEKGMIRNKIGFTSQD